MVLDDGTQHQVYFANRTALAGVRGDRHAVVPYPAFACGACPPGRVTIETSDRLWTAVGAAVINDLHFKLAGAILHRICNAKRNKA